MFPLGFSTNKLKFVHIKGLYPPNFLKKKQIIFGFLIFFGTLNYGESHMLFICVV